MEFTTILLVLFMFWFFDHEACGILASQPGMEPTSPALDSEVSTTEVLGKSPKKMVLG